MSDSLIQLATELTRIIVPIIMFVGIIGNLLNMVVLTRPVLYRHACSRYFLAAACDNLVFTSIMLLYRLLADGYHLDVTKYSLMSCKLVTYFYQITGILSAYFIVLASIDRYCASSRSARLRKFSNIKITRWTILFVIIVIMLFYTNTAVLIDLQSNDTFGCRIRANTIYKKIYPIMQVILVTLLAPGLMTFFGIMTIYNTKRIGILPARLARDRRTERQLMAMLLVQVSTHIVLFVPICITYLILVLPNAIQSTSTFYFIRLTSQTLLYLSFATPFVLYLISARIYRKELMQLIHNIVGLRVTRQVHPATNITANTGLPRNTTVFKMSAIHQSAM